MDHQPFKFYHPNCRTGTFILYDFPTGGLASDDKTSELAMRDVRLKKILSFLE